MTTMVVTVALTMVATMLALGACDAAGVPRWHPHRLRHSAATELRKEFGIEAAVVGIEEVDQALAFE